MPTQRLSPRDQRASSSEFWAEERRDSRAARPLQIPDESRERPGRDGHAHVPTRGPTSPGPTALAGMARSQTDVSAMQPRETGPPVRGPRRARPRNAGRTEHARAGTSRSHRRVESPGAAELRERFEGDRVAGRTEQRPTRAPASPARGGTEQQTASSLKSRSFCPFRSSKQ